LFHQPPRHPAPDRPRPDPGTEQTAAKTPPAPEIDALRPHVDTAFSLATYPDIAAGRLDPVLHYHNHGWRELRDPLVTVSLDGATPGVCPTSAVTAAVAGARPHL
jgi:hypothetical protein